MNLNKKEKILNQPSALTTFRIIQGEYFNVTIEKIIFSLLLKAQQELREDFRTIFLEKIKKILPGTANENKLLPIVENIYKEKFKHNITTSDLKMTFLKKVADEVTNFLEEQINISTSDEEERELLKQNIAETKLWKYSTGVIDRVTEKDIPEIIWEIKDYCKKLSLKKHNDRKSVNFTTLVKSVNGNKTRIKEELSKACNTVLSYNYINKKKINISVTSSIVASVRVEYNKKSKISWLIYQIPEEILELLIIPQIYVPLEEAVIHKVSGPFTIRMYGFLKDHIKIGGNGIDVTKEELFNFFSLPESYKNKNLLENYFLKPTLKEIEEGYGIKTTYKFVPTNGYKKIIFYPKQIRKVKKETLTILTPDESFADIKENEKIQVAIKKAKRNIFVSKAWNKRVDNKLEKLLVTNGEAYVLNLLKILYNDLKKEIKSTLVQYINGIIKNKKLDASLDEMFEETEVQEVVNEETNPEELIKEEQTNTIDIMYNFFLQMGENTKKEILKKAEKIFLEGIGADKMNPTYTKAFELSKKAFIIKALSS